MKIPVYCNMSEEKDRHQDYTYFKFNSHSCNNPVTISLNEKFDNNVESDKRVHVYIPYGTTKKSLYTGKKELEALCWKDAHNRFYNSTLLYINKDCNYFDLFNCDKIYTLRRDKNDFYISDDVSIPHTFKIYKSDIVDNISMIDINENDKCIFLDKYKNIPALSYCIKIIDKDKYSNIYNNHVYSILNETESYFEIVEVFL